MANVKSELTSFEEFKISAPTYLKGGIQGTITGSRYYQGQSYVDVDWEIGVPTCDIPTTGTDYAGAGGERGGDALLGKKMNK